MNAYDIIFEIFKDLEYNQVELVKIKKLSGALWRIPDGQKIYVDPGSPEWLGGPTDGILLRDGHGAECTIHCYGTEVDVSNTLFPALNITLNLVDPNSIEDLKNRLA